MSYHSDTPPPAPICFYWAYHPQYWKGLEKHGFIDENIGVRLVHSVYAEESQKANAMLVPDGALSQMILSNGYGLLIDRGCGGIEYKDYLFDPKLMELYAQKLGKRFLGVQMHEWHSNTRNDYRRIHSAGGVDAYLSKLKEQNSAEVIGGYTEYGHPQDYQNRTFPQDYASFVAEANYHYLRHKKNFGGYVNMADSYNASYWQAALNGAQSLQAELGSQTPLSRLQLIAARGAARSFDITWGVYYEPWTVPYTVCWAYRGHSFWAFSKAQQQLSYFSAGVNGGSSRALQYRILFYAMLTGAHTFVEEWGGENTFADWDDFELTEYGKVMQTAFQFSRKVDVGKPVIKVALMLDEGFTAPEHVFYRRPNHAEVPTDIQLKHEHNHLHIPIKATLKSLLIGHEEDVRIQETASITSSPFPEVMDLVFSDITTEALGAYDLVFYLGNSMTEAQQRHHGFQGTWMNGLADKATEQLKSWLQKDLPVWVEGRVTWTLSQTDQGWLIGLFNNHGVNKDAQKNEVLDRSQDNTVTIRCTLPGFRAHLLDVGRTDLSTAPITPRDQEIRLIVPAGDVRVVEIR